MVIQEIQFMARIAVSIVLEAAPFLLLGSLLSAAIERYVDTERIGTPDPKRAARPHGRRAAGRNAHADLRVRFGAPGPPPAGEGGPAPDGGHLYARRAGHQSGRPALHLRGLRRQYENGPFKGGGGGRQRGPDGMALRPPDLLQWPIRFHPADGGSRPDPSPSSRRSAHCSRRAFPVGGCGSSQQRCGRVFGHGQIPRI